MTEEYDRMIDLINGVMKDDDRDRNTTLQMYDRVYHCLLGEKNEEVKEIFQLCLGKVCLRKVNYFSMELDKQKKESDLLTREMSEEKNILTELRREIEIKNRQLEKYEELSGKTLLEINTMVSSLTEKDRIIRDLRFLVSEKNETIERLRFTK